MPRYQLNARTFINGTLREPGDIVEYGGWPGSSLEPQDEIAASVKAQYDDMKKRGRTIPGAPDMASFVKPAAIEPPEADVVEAAPDPAAEEPAEKPKHGKRGKTNA